TAIAVAERGRDLVPVPVVGARLRQRRFEAGRRAAVRDRMLCRRQRTGGETFRLFLGVDLDGDPLGRGGRRRTDALEGELRIGGSHGDVRGGRWGFGDGYPAAEAQNRAAR